MAWVVSTVGPSLEWSGPGGRRGVTAAAALGPPAPVAGSVVFASACGRGWTRGEKGSCASRGVRRVQARCPAGPAMVPGGSRYGAWRVQVWCLAGPGRVPGDSRQSLVQSPQGHPPGGSGFGSGTGTGSGSGPGSGPGSGSGSGTGVLVGGAGIWKKAVGSPSPRGTGHGVVE
jgi:hypothetical protein